MQRVILICLFFSVLFFASCSFIQRKEKVNVYSQILVTNDTLDKMTQEWHQLLSKALVTKNFTYLAPHRIRMAQFLSRSRPKVANLEITPSSESIRDSEEVFLTNQATFISDVYPQFESNNELTPNEVLQNQMKALGNDLENETSVSASIRQSLHTYAKKNGLNVPE
jgi:hypothetical protein